MSRHVSCCVLALLIGCQTGDEPTAAVVSAAAGSDQLASGEGLSPDQSIVAGNTALVYQGDNNLVLYQNGSPIWASNAGQGSPPSSFVMQSDCNAVVYSANGPTWSSETAGEGGGCVARVIEGDWFICSGTRRVFSARGGGSCGGSEGYQCHEPSGAVPLPGIENYHVRIDPDSLYVCDTLVGYEFHAPWPQPSPTEVNEQCVGACGAGCSGNTCSRTSLGNYRFVTGNIACADVRYDCYSTDCCYYHDLCGRMFPTAVFTDPFCHALAIVYGCVGCIGPGFPGCSGAGYNRSFVHPYTDFEDCLCFDRPGDCFDDCTGACYFGCDVNFDCFDDCTGIELCGCPSWCDGFCDPSGFCDFAPSSPAALAAPELEIQLVDRTERWPLAELMAHPVPITAASPLSPLPTGPVATGWSLRELVQARLGADYRATAIVGDDGARVELDAIAWRSPDNTPVLRPNRSGQLRFHWTGPRDHLPGVRAVAAIEVVRDAK